MIQTHMHGIIPLVWEVNAFKHTEQEKIDRVKTEHLFVKINVLTWGKCSIFYHSWSWTNVSQQSEHVSIHTIFIKSFEVFTITVQMKKKNCCLAFCLQKGYSTHTFTNTNYTPVMCLLYFIHYFFLIRFLHGWVQMTVS